MYLRSLTLKGFKSFADSTTLEFEPGITVVVGPNGSGKSNVVDAVAWVLGAQGPSVVRSAKMDDVIFAGTAKRAPLGRAEVSLVIDNSSRRLPIDLAEVKVTRTLFRTGESEYAINGSPCRLLDVQELFSDTGVGRQQHVIIGQGQLDAVLTARPEDRRMVIEEAAGVLKYRRRRERAERRLEASESSLARLQDLLREVRRQLKPLERQAASAGRHEELEQELTALRLYLAGRELAELGDQQRALGREQADLEARAESARFELTALDRDLAAIQELLGHERAEELAPVLGRLAQLDERAKGLASLALERRRAAAELLAAAEDADAVVTLEHDLAEAGRGLERTEADLSALAPERAALAETDSGLAAAEAEHVERFGLSDETSDAARAAELRAAESIARSELSERREEEIRRSAAREALDQRLTEEEHRSLRAAQAAEQAARDLARCDAELAELGTGLARAEALAASAAEAEVAAEADRHRVGARLEALESAFATARARAGLERLQSVPGVLGALLDLVEVDERAELAFAAALEGGLDAVLVQSGNAREAVRALRTGQAPASLLPVGHEATGASPPVPAGTVPLRSLVRSGNPGCSVLLDRLLAGVGFLADDAEALELALVEPRATIVTAAGDRFSPFGWRIGAARAGVTAAALAAAREEHAGAEVAATRAHEDGEQARSRATVARRGHEEAARRRAQVEHELRREEQAVARARAAAAALRDEVAVADAALAEARAALAEAGESHEGVAAELAEQEAVEAAALEHSAQRRVARRDLEERASELAERHRDLELRETALAERRVLLREGRDQLERSLAARLAERELAASRRDAFALEDRALSGLAARLEASRVRLAGALAEVGRVRDARAARGREQLDRLGAVRRTREERERALAALLERHQRAEIEAAEARVRREAAIDALARDLDAAEEEAVAAPRPDLVEGADPVQRRRELERELRLLGPVNPLAREELAALEERHGFLESQLEDVRNARRELNLVIRAVDTEIVEAFTAAFADVERHFAALVSTLFPGGSGRMSLTDPEDLLATGVEIEARPAGRNVRRLSLLSGGERSLVALCFLFAVFRSRPSPFYLLDEVEAALDEANLRRFLELVEEFREEAQLVIVSHQKKTMEVADALYGISMQPGGASKVVTERLRRQSPAVVGPGGSGTT